MSNELIVSEEELKELERQAINEDSMGLRLSVKKIKMPTGGSTYFELGENDTTGDLIGLIIDNYDTRTCFMEAFNGEQNKPDCQSFNCITGIDKDGNEVTCESCGLYKYHKGEKTKCSTRRRLYILLEGQDLPYLLVVPPTSMRSFRKYVAELQYKNQTTRTVLTRMFLKKEKSADGFPYAELQFLIQRELTGEERAEALLKAKNLRGLTRFTYSASPEEEAVEESFVPDEV